MFFLQQLILTGAGAGTAILISEVLFIGVTIILLFPLDAVEEIKYIFLVHRIIFN
jgi:hypothetical protein